MFFPGFHNYIHIFKISYNLTFLNNYVKNQKLSKCTIILRNLIKKQLKTFLVNKKDKKTVQKWSKLFAVISINLSL